MKLYPFACAFALACSLTACAYTNHLLEEEREPADGSYHVVSDMPISAYDSWIYINLETGETETHPDAGEWIYDDGSIRAAGTEEEVGMEWHVAVHRYDFRTNNARVLDTGVSDISSITERPSGTYVADEPAPYEDELAKEEAGEAYYYILSMDMTDMMSGNVGYAHYPLINRPLCGSVIRTPTGSMPPYTYDVGTKPVFVLQWDDGSWAKLQITSTFSSRQTTGYLAFNYIYYPGE